MSAADVARHARIEAALGAARERDGRVAFIGYLELYCENPRCSVREVTVRVKEFTGPTPARLRCPACSRQLERDARSSVNAQLYIERPPATTRQGTRRSAPRRTASPCAGAHKLHHVRTLDEQCREEDA